VEVRVQRAEGQKCARCWTFSESVGRSLRYPDVCARCAGVLDEIAPGTGGGYGKGSGG